jgi:FixJ family two-component response regulator
MAQNPIICIVDDDEAVRDSLQVLLETVGYITQVFELGPQFLEACGVAGAGCALIDIRMPKMGGMEVLQHLKEIRQDLPVIIITGQGDVTLAAQAMREGAIDFIEKPFEEEALLASVENALSIANQSRGQDETKAAIHRGIARLTPRERDVFDRLIIGHANKVIARALDCSPRMVEIHRARIMEKTDSSSVAHLVRMAVAADIEIAEC